MVKPVAVGQDVALLRHPLLRALKPQELQALDLELWQKKREWPRSGPSDKYDVQRKTGVSHHCI
nr:hypothetical protein [Enterobacter asburiae]